MLGLLGGSFVLSNSVVPNQFFKKIFQFQEYFSTLKLQLEMKKYFLDNTALYWIGTLMISGIKMNKNISQQE